MDQVVGVDISKARLDVFCLASGRRLAVANDAAGVAELAGWLSPAAWWSWRRPAATSGWCTGS